MKLDTVLNADLAEASDQARTFEALGLDGVFTFEGNRDIFYPLVMAAAATKLDIYTNVAVAFPRSPMHVAYQAYDLHRLSGGRFTLGLGSQIRPHIEKRYSATWGKPVAHMREFIEATKAIFHSFDSGDRLNFTGDYYNFTLLTPMFNPGPLPSGPPAIWAGALGPKMTAMVAESADGLLIHPFNTKKFIDEHTVPAVRAGREACGKTMDGFDFGILAMVGAYRTAQEEEIARRGCRYNLAFYGSTPSYRVTLDAHGWGDLQTELNTMTKAGRWDEIGDVVDDEILETIAVIGTPDEVAEQLLNRFGGVATRVGLSIPYAMPNDLLGEVIAACRARGM